MSARRQAERLVDLTIDALGGSGDGVASHDGRTIYVPFTLPGDRVQARLVARDRALPVAWHVHGAGRVEAACPHFGTCGGCTLQHLDEARYVAWKTERLQAALARHRLDGVRIAPPVRIGAGQRRRAEFALQRRGHTVTVGFHAAAGSGLVAIGPCPVLRPELEALLPRLSAGLRDALHEGEKADLQVTLTDGGADALITLAREPDLKRLEALSQAAAACDLARLAWRTAAVPATPAAERRKPRISFRSGERDVAVDLPPGAFLQPSAAGERALTDAVTVAAAGARRMLDLYAGCGTFALPLAAGRSVHAVDGDAAMVAALAAAARRAGLGRLTTAARDLAHRPLLPDEVSGFDAVVFDPPFAGALAQSRFLAAAKVPLVIGVSCNPATFARDARVLCDGGLRLAAVTPVDQFVWSPHLELVGVFRR